MGLPQQEDKINSHFASRLIPKWLRAGELRGVRATPAQRGVGGTRARAALRGWQCFEEQADYLQKLYSFAMFLIIPEIQIYLPLGILAIAQNAYNNLLLVLESI